MGSQPTYMCGQNFDFAGFIPLVREVYHFMERDFCYLRRQLPFCVFQHAMTEALLVHMLQAKRCQVPGFHDLGYLPSFSWKIPLPIYEYIVGIGAQKTVCGQEVHWNWPDAAVPQKAIEGPIPCRSGTFGIPTAANHNAYECYISPYITSEYVKQQAKVTEDTKNFDWDPFPTGWLPANCEVNENLLGYRRLEHFQLEAANICLDCKFKDSGVLGLLCHSSYAISKSSSVLDRLVNIKSVQMRFEVKRNNAAFIISEFREREGSEIILWREPSTKCSPFSFDENAHNRSERLVYKRKRNKEAPGAFALCNGQLIDGWLETINDNFECTGSFGLWKFKDRKSLREENHMASSFSIPSQAISSWLGKSF